MKVSLITHLSGTHPLMPADLVEGLKLALEETAQINTHFKSHDAGTKDITEEVQKSLLMGEDLVIVYSGIDNLLAVQELVKKFGKPAILIDSEAQPGRQALDGADTYWLSMQLQESSYCLGELASQTEEVTYASLQDFINAGYQMCDAFEKGLFTANEKGSIVSRFITPAFQEAEESMPAAKAELQKNEANVVFCNAIGQEGELFVELIKDEDLNDTGRTWFLAPSLISQTSFEDLRKINNLQGISTWHVELPESENFRRSFEEKVNRIPSIFGVIGYEAGLIAKAIKEKDLGEINGPRGTLSWEEEERKFYASQYQFSLEKGNREMEIKNYANLLKVRKEFTKKLNHLVESGWKNPYLCY